jgi:hypothetical protein
MDLRVEDTQRSLLDLKEDVQDGIEYNLQAG